MSSDTKIKFNFYDSFDVLSVQAHTKKNSTLAKMKTFHT